MGTSPLRGLNGGRALPWALLSIVIVVAQPPPLALELRGRSVFIRPPSEAELITYSATRWAPAEYYLTIEIPQAAGAPLAELTVRQIGGVDWQFPFLVDRTRAFLGRPRQEGQQLPVQASFETSTRRFTLLFRQPIEPASTLTVVLVPWYNPSQADVYQFAVVAYPAGMNPEPSPVGVLNLRIYDPIE